MYVYATSFKRWHEYTSQILFSLSPFLSSLLSLRLSHWNTRSCSLTGWGNVSKHFVLLLPRRCGRPESESYTACHLPVALFDLHATSLLHWLTYIGREGVIHVLVHTQSSMWPAVQPSLPVWQCDSICQYTLLVWVDSCSHLPGKEWRSRMGHLFHLSMDHFLWCVTGNFDLQAPPLTPCLGEILYMHLADVWRE